jgi:murein DD-endopeptidase MepM/ murein hydrolase activator NlpD
LLDRSDWDNTRRRGTDLVRVQQTRTISRYGRDAGARKQAPAIFLSELGPRRAVKQLKWFISTIIVATSGLAIIGIAIYASMHIGDGSGMIGAMRRAGIEAMKRRGDSTPGAEKPVAIGMKTDRLVLSSKGLATKNLIYDQIIERRGTRDFMTTKAYAKVTATLPLDRPDDSVQIPPFNPADLFGNEAPITRKDQAGGELTSDPRVSVRLIDVAGGFLPREDNQELSNDEAERLVAEADAIYSESDASLSEPLDTDGESDNAQAQAAPEKNTTVLYKKNDEEDSDDSFDTRSITARGGETVDMLLKGAGVDIVQSARAGDAVAKIMKTKKLRAGEELRLALTPSSVEEGGLDVVKLSLFYQSTAELTLARNADGTFVPSDSQVSAESDSDDNAGERPNVYVSTFRAARSQDLPQDLIMKFLKLHSYDADYKQRVRAGDGFEMFYAVHQEESQPEKPGELLYAAITLGGETKGYYRFRTPDGQVDYYDDKGSNSKKFLVIKPIRNARLTSGFGYRMHPLLHTLKLHSGIDWAGPVGTPIMAAGSGVIEVAERHGGYGNYVRIRHANGYKTAYGHMLRFAEGVAKGVKVRQGQVIGYMGNSGMSTGAHLHFEVLINNRFTNPLAIKIPRSRVLQGRLLADFRREKARIDDLMHRTPVKTRVAAIEK